MQQDAISVALQVPGLVVLGTREDEATLEIAARYAGEEVACPHCARPSAEVHQWHRQWKRDEPLWGKTVWLMLWKRRLRCRPCRRVFTEPDPVCGRRRRTTCRMRARAAEQAQEASVRAVARWHGVSEGLVERSWRERYGVPRPPAGPHRFLGLDGFCVRRPGRMWTGLWDLESRAPVAVVPGERQVDLERLLTRHTSSRQVRAVVTDLAEHQRQALAVALPAAVVVADRFHVVALGGRALREVRGGRRQRGNVAWLLDRGAERLSAAEQARLATALAADRVLARAWSLKERLRSLYALRTRREAEAALDGWIAEAESCGLEPFARTARTLQSWREEVLNYWRYRITNALVEGKHNRVKTLKRRAYGYRNDRAFMLRILNCFHTD